MRARFTTPFGADQVVWVTDADGEDALEVAAITGGSARRLAGGELGQVVDLAASPDGRWVATAGDDFAVRITDAEGGETRELDRSSCDIASGLCFSPDSGWLAWSSAVLGGDEDGLRQIKLARVDDGAVHEATPLRFSDWAPAFTPDGRYLAFLSRRTFDPIYDELRFDLSFPAATRPYLLRLAAATPVRCRRSRAVASCRGTHRQPTPTRAPKEPAAGVQRRRGVAEVVVEPEALATRLVELPVAAGRLADLRAVTGGLVWRSLPVAGELGEDRAEPFGDPVKGRLERLDFATGRVETLAEAGRRGAGIAATGARSSSARPPR